MIDTPVEFQRMVDLYREWNEKINVVSRKDIDSLYHHHILHSLAIAEYLRRFYPSVAGFLSGPESAPENVSLRETPPPTLSAVPPLTVPRVARFSWGSSGPDLVLPIEVNKAAAAARPARDFAEQSRQGLKAVGSGGYLPSKYNCAKVLDLGTGGGFPGIPLATVFPEAEFTLCDSIGKKVRVAQAVAEGLGLKNVTCVNARAESLPGPFDWIVSRAVTSLENFYPWVRGKYNNSILYLKGGDVDVEIDVLVRKFKVPSGNIRTWKISEWLENDDYFAEKFVIEIGKNYLCAPNTNN